MQPKLFSYPLWEIVHPNKFLSFWTRRSLVLKEFLIEFPKTLLINLFLSNLVILVSFIVSVDWLAVNLLIHQGTPAFPSSKEPHFCHTSAVPFKFSKQHFSESCCGCRESQNNVVRHSSRNHRCLKILLWQLPYSK